MVKIIRYNNVIYYEYKEDKITFTNDVFEYALKTNEYDMILYNDMIEELYKEGLFKNHLQDLVDIIKDEIDNKYEDFVIDIPEYEKIKIKNNMINHHKFGYIIKDNIELFI